MIRTLCQPRTFRISDVVHSKYHYQPIQQLIRLQSTDRISTPVSFARRTSGPKQDNEKTTTYGWLMLLIPITTFGLGCWQVKRKLWKEGLVKELEVQTSKPPVDFPKDIEELNNMEYQSVRVRGRFLHEREVTMGPRSLIAKDSGEHKGGLITRQDSSIGFLVVTPFQLEGTDHTILVNRGWVPRKSVNASVRPGGQITGTVDLVGVVRSPEQRPQFSPKCSGDTFLYRDIPRMCSLTGSDPYLIDATAESTVPGGPIGGQTRITLRNEHMSYIVTWFSLSAFTSYLWYRQIFKRIPR